MWHVQCETRDVAPNAAPDRMAPLSPYTAAKLNPYCKAAYCKTLAKIRQYCYVQKP
jgi:hypothetical protein